MKLCSPAVCVLLLLTITDGSGSLFPSVEVEYNGTAVLPCTVRCSGVVRWMVFHKRSDILAECDQTSCRSVKEGYQMIYDQYLQGNLSLIITEADFRKKALYTCQCDEKDVCDVNLQVEAVNTQLQVVSGQPLQLDLDTPEPVEIRFNRTNSDSDQICTVDGRSTQCQHEYSNRASVISVLELRGTKPSDSGIYTVLDTRNDVVIRTYTVDVQEGGDGSEALRQEHKLSRSRRSSESYCQPCVCSSQTAEVPGWVVPVLAVMGTALFVALVVIVLLVRRSLQLQKEPERNRDVHPPANEHQGNEANGANNSTQQSTELSSLTSPQKPA